MGRRLGSRAKPQHDVGARDQGPGAFNAAGLDLVTRFAQPRSVGQQNRQSPKRQRDFNIITCGSRDGTYNCSIDARYRIDKAGLSSVRWTGDDNSDAFFQRLDARPQEPRVQIRDQRCHDAAEARIERRVVIVGIIDRAFGDRGQAKHLFLPLGDLAPERAIGERQRRLVLGLRLRLEQVRKTLGFGQVDPAMVEGTAGKFPGLGGTQTGDPAERAKHQVDHRAAAMTMQLHHVFAGRTRRRRKSQDQRFIQ